jgi:lipopolysaccharide export system protein LptA
VETLKAHSLKKTADILLICLLAVFGAGAGTLLLIPGAALAAQETRPAGLTSLHITADRLTANQNNQHVVFSGHVIALYDGKKITSDQLQVFYDRGSEPIEIGNTDNSGVKKVIASGNVFIEFEDKTATCDQAVYVAATSVMILSGTEVKLRSDTNYITGTKITINQDSGQILVDGTTEKRVNAVFQPEANNSETD